MEDNENMLYHKRELLTDRINNDRWNCIAEIFQLFQLDDLRKIINQWLIISLVNDQSAYYEGHSRKNIMRFCNKLKLLAEALYVMSEGHKPRGSDIWKKRLPDDLKKALNRLNRPRILSQKQLSDPILVIKNFCKTFPRTYARAELWDLLDAVITYEEAGGVNKVNLLMSYQCILCLVESAYNLILKTRSNTY